MQLHGNLLIVDDEEDLRNFLEFRLLKEGHSVTAAANGREALALLDRTEFDLVISDVMMPGLSGIDVLRQVKERAPDTEVIVATGYAALETAVECLRAGAADLLQKPIHLKELSRSVQRALERRHLHVSNALYQASQTVFSASDPRTLPERIVEIAAGAIEGQDASLLLAGPDGCLALAHRSASQTPFSAEEAGAFARRVQEALSKDAAPSIAIRGQTPSWWLTGMRGMEGIGSTLVHPLRYGDRLAGVLVLGRATSARPFRKADLAKGAVLASQVLLALENARLLSQSVSAERLASIGQLAASIAHEINTPMSYLLGNLEYVRISIGRLLPGSDEARCSDLAQAIDDAIEGALRIRDIAQDLRGLARTTEDRVPVDLTACVQAALRVAGAALRGHVEVTTRLEPGLVVTGSPGHLSQVVINLLVNAGQAISGLARGRGRIDILSKTVDGQAVLEISDTGPGIAPEHLPLLFEPFFTTKALGEGTGLGLWICRDILRRHGGEICVRSVPGAGAVFSVVLPLASS